MLNTVVAHLNDELRIKNMKKIFHNLDYSSLTNHTIAQGEGIQIPNGTLVIKTGKFTGRSPKDRFIVKDQHTLDSIDWGEINQPISPENFEKLHKKTSEYFTDKDIYVQDCKAGADDRFAINVRVVADKPWSAHFVKNMFRDCSSEELDSFSADWTVMVATDCQANPATDGTRQGNYSVINFDKKLILVGGSGYTGEIKKGIFSVLNFLLPSKNVFPMHCSSNVGNNGDAALFFGLSGTGKTTLSSDPNRALIGDDEHGWSEDGVYNFEGGCYAKCIDLTEEKEPGIFQAIRPPALLENIICTGENNEPDYTNDSITQNIRVSYPLDSIENRIKESKAGHPKNIFFLTCDAFGVLPPISRLNKDQAMRQFLLGYTAKVAGTEAGVNEPTATFSAGFGAPFLPLHPNEYASMLGEKMNLHKTKVWLVNTGWVGGKYGVGERIALKYTRQLINCALDNTLDYVDYSVLPGFNFAFPDSCPGVPDHLLNPKNAWQDGAAYDEQAANLLKLFNKQEEKLLAFA